MSSDKRKKNNEARMKVYDKKKEEEAWNQYEHYIVEHHFKKYKHTVWHWSRVPEEHLWNAGYINDFNKHRLERLASSKEGINRHKDYGLDGFALDLDKNYHGLQAKFYSTNKVSANDIGTFYSVTRRLNKKNPLSKGYLYTSTNLEPTLAEDIECIGDIIHEKVLFEPEDKRKTRHQKKVVEEVNLPLRQYQKDALESLKEEREGLGTLSLFCGGGKTLIAGHYLSELKPKIIVMMAPLKISVDNLRQRMESFFNGYDHLVIDSDSGNTTDLDVVKAKLDEDKPIILYTTFASAVNVLSEIFDENEELFEDSFCLVDECHNILNNTELCEFISRFYDGLLMSATIPEELYEVIDCEPVYEYGMAEAIKEEYCVDYNVWLPLVVKKEETNSIEIDIPEEFEKSDLCAKVLFLVNGMLQTGSKRCIVYLRNTDECAAFTELFTKVSKEYHGLSSWTETIDCDVKQEKRRTILEEFQTDKDDLTTLHILASVRILDEAVDVVRCDSEFITYVGVNADDKRAVQRLQRGGRLDLSNPSKKNNLFIWCSEYASMLSMLSLLKESDPEFHTKLRILNGDYNAVGKKESIEKSAIQLGDLQKYVEVRCLSADEVWEEKYYILKELFIDNPPTYNKDNLKEKNIAKWMYQQRSNYKKRYLTENKIKKLENFNWWVWEKNLDNIWLNHYNNLIKYYNDNKSFPSKKEKKLHNWVTTQKLFYKENKLSNERINKLEYLDWWIWNLDNKWHYKYNELIQFYKLNTRLPLFKNNNKEKSLCTWVSKQRKKYNDKTLNNNYVNKLNNLTWWNWDISIETKWHNKYNEVIKYIETNNKFPSHSKNNNKLEKELGLWISKQKLAYKETNLSEDKIKKLEKLDNWTWKKDFDNLWNESLKRIIEYINKNNKLPSGNSTNLEEKKIAKWINIQKYNYRNNIIWQERILILEKLNWWKW
jgi:superfamily II DNA or RNA helicase